jgi:hypothetical protein
VHEARCGTAGNLGESGVSEVACLHKTKQYCSGWAPGFAPDSACNRMHVRHQIFKILKRRALPTSCQGICGCRAFFTLPNLSSLSPFPSTNEPEPQTYHERKIFPCVSMLPEIGIDFKRLHADTGVVSYTKSLQMLHRTPLLCRIAPVQGFSNARRVRTE